MKPCYRLIVSAWIAVGGAVVGTGSTLWAQDQAQSGETDELDQSVEGLVPCEFEDTDPVWPRTWELGHGITFRLRGRIDTDAIWSAQSAANEAIFGELGDVVGLRRARIGAEGDLGDNSRYIVEIDLATGFVVPRDVYVACGDREARGEWQFGHFREPFSLEGGTSARFFAFMERSPVNMLDPSRNWGVGLFRENPDENTSFALGAFHAGTDAGDFEGGDGSTVGLTCRLTRALINEGDGERLLHFGLALSERVPENGVIRINQQPRSPLLDVGDSSTSPFVPAITIPARYQQLINVQAAAAHGPLWAQAEWYGTLIDQTGGGTVFFRGSYVDCGYFLTGEHRKYEASSGTLGAVRVNRPFLRSAADCDRPHGWGAWEIAARFTYLDFFDSDTPLGPSGQLVGIELPQSTIGVNWYLCDRVRLMFNYSYAVPNEMNTGTSAANIFGTRLGVFW
jgi:phosphate-selective porin OprO/OprP